MVSRRPIEIREREAGHVRARLPCFCPFLRGKDSGGLVMVGEWKCWWDVVEFAPRGKLPGYRRTWR